MDINFWLLCLGLVLFGYLIFDLIIGIISHNNMRHDKPISGNLSVSGQSSISIELHRPTVPTEVIVKFDHTHHHPHPCGHNHHDKVDWQLKEHNNGRHFLVIEWNILDGFRDIIWEVRF